MIKKEFYPDGSIKSFTLVEDEDEQIPSGRPLLKRAADSGDSEELFNELFGNDDPPPPPEPLPPADVDPDLDDLLGADSQF